MLFQTGDGGSFSVDSVDTDVNGEAQTLWTLGPGAGAQAATATVAGFAAVQAGVGATAAAGVTVSWSNGAGGDWSAPANWTPSRVPGAGDTAVIDLAGTYAVAIAANHTVAALTLGGASGTQTLTLGPASSLDVVGNAQVNPAGVIEMNDARLASSAGLLTLAGALRVTAGVAQLNIPSVVGGTVDVQGGELEVWLGGAFSGAVNVASGATLTVLSGAAVNLSGSSTVDGNLAVLATGGVAFNGGTHVLGSTSTVSGAGTLDVAAGSVTVLGGYDLTGITALSGAGALLFENTTTPAVTSDLVVAGGAL
ncbi:MAG: hypothetical protein JSW43_05595, partial [Gemmatimonadota bacterium]